MQDDALLNWVKVAAVDDLWEGDFIDAEVEGEEIIVVHLFGGQLRAYQGMCPHQEVLLADGNVDIENGVITCSAHEWQFNIDDGSGRNPKGCQLFRYDVKREGDDIFIGVPTDGRLRRLRHSVDD